ncbi:hypothetical protein HOLleu_16902 [Holothuria leucospilota]|uniref:Dolichol phosphate-mannose biosynthesis regulatory protein n=1 Tax=Holothuria leucospilota TaxID=206669 RepID=A0A9Q1C6X5_HOLLE|nr:hypothetical protein HOLleu_16902 [Holothuria leucospilota]
MFFFQPFVEPDQFLHNLFLPRAYAVILPLVAGVIVLTFIGEFKIKGKTLP